SDAAQADGFRDAVQYGSGKSVADRSGESVGRIAFGKRAKAEQTLDGVLNLDLVGAAVTDHRLLDHHWSVFGQRDAGRRGGSHRNAARFAESERALNITGDEVAFETEAVRLMRRHHRQQLSVDLKETHCDVAATRIDDAGIQMKEARTVTVDHSPATTHRSRIDAENPQAALPLPGPASGTICAQRPVRPPAPTRCPAGQFAIGRARYETQRNQTVGFAAGP